MLKSLFDAVMERRAGQLIEQVGEWLPAAGPCWTSARGPATSRRRLERELGLEVVTADVSDMHVVGRPPVLIADGVLPFDDGNVLRRAALLHARLPERPCGCAGGSGARHARARSSWCRSLYSGRFGYAWHRVREFVWTIVAFHVSKLIGYVPPEAKFTMQTRRFYTAQHCRRSWRRPGCASGRGGSGRCSRARALRGRRRMDALERDD